MRTIAIYSFLLFACLITAHGQNISHLSTSTKTPHVCSFNCSTTYEGIKSNCFFDNPANTVRSSQLKSSDVNPYDEFDFIKYTLSQDPNNPFRLDYQFKECAKTCNASAVEIDKIKYIFYNQDYINNLDSDDNNLKWIVRFIIGHEIGHHILGHTGPKASKKLAIRRKAEIRADFFAGFVIKQFPGSTIDDALAALNSMDPTNYEPRNENEEKSSFYPLLSKRKQAVKEGFSDNDSLKVGMFDDIKSIALASLKEYGRSSIYRTMDNLISHGNFLDAKELIDDILGPQINNEVFTEQELLVERKFLGELKTDLVNKVKDKEIEQLNQRELDINQKEMDKVFEIYTKYKSDPTIFNKEQSDILKKSIRELQSIEIREH